MGSVTSRIAAVALWALAGCAATSAGGKSRDEPRGINLWPLFESQRLPDGGEHDSVLLLYHRTTDASGATQSFHVLNYLSGPDYQVLFPLVWHTGRSPDDSLHVVPFYFSGPDYRLSPPLLSAWWRWHDRETTTWITPLYHETRDRDGNLESRHALCFFQGRDYGFLPPLFLAGRDWWAAPLALSGSWATGHGGTTTWITPLFHETHDASGATTSFHVANFFSGEDGTAFFPLFFASGSSWCLFPLAARFDGGGQDRSLWVTPLFHYQDGAGGTSFHLFNYAEGPGWSTLFPLYVKSPSSLFLPPLLSGSFAQDDGTRSLWITPLFHDRTAADGSLVSRHLLTCYQTEDSFGVLPFYLRGPSYEIIPPLLTASWGSSAGERTTWVAPLFHVTTDAQGHRWMHVLNYVEGPDDWVFFPLAYGSEDRAGRTLAVLPVYFETPHTRLVLPALSGAFEGDDGSRSLWLTPLYHQTVAADGTVRSRHLLNFYQEGGFTFVFPLAYQLRKPNGTHRGLLPLWVDGPGYDASPLLLSGRWRNDDGDQSLWITPLFHVRTGEHEVRSWHLVNYLAGPGYDVWFPFFWSLGEDGHRSIAVPPFYFESARWKVAPLCLSWWRRSGDASETTWITPLFHETREPDGACRSWHLATYAAGDGYDLFFPLYFHWTRSDGADRTLVPLLYSSEVASSGETSRSLVGPLVTWRQGRALDTSLLFQLRPFSYQDCADGSEVNFLWRLFHTRTKAGASETTVGPLFSSDRPEPDVPFEYQILGGLFARDCNYAAGTYRHRILWLFPIGEPTPFPSSATAAR